jgi:septal ring factor EnvC (AmiA/AmiB activator)
MKKFLIKNYKEILLIVFSCSIVFILTKLYSQTTDNSELIKYKLEQLDKNIDEVNQRQKELDTLILNYKKDIEKIDSTINNIRVEKKTINNYYDKKSQDIRNSSTKQVDSLFKSRYKY